MFKRSLKDTCRFKSVSQHSLNCIQAIRVRCYPPWPFPHNHPIICLPTYFLVILFSMQHFNSVTTNSKEHLFFQIFSCQNFGRGSAPIQTANSQFFSQSPHHTCNIQHHVIRVTHDCEQFGLTTMKSVTILAQNFLKDSAPVFFSACSCPAGCLPTSQKLRGIVN